MLRIPAVLFWLLLLAGCAGGGTSQQTVELPQNVKDEIIARYYEPENNRNVRFVETGEGTILPFEQGNGVTKIICLKIQYEKKLPPDTWAAGVNSRIILQSGNDWSVNNALQWVERAWLQHSCPGLYESVAPK